jgi:UDP-glucuronate 4-epimerase
MPDIDASRIGPRLALSSTLTLPEKFPDTMRFLITGTAGFIGFHLARRLLADGHVVHGVDSFTPYYDPALKQARHRILEGLEAFTPHAVALEDDAGLRRVAMAAEPGVVVHLAAQAGVRYGIANPRAYVDANLVGTFNVLEVARELSPNHLVLGSTSSIYGMDTASPFRESAAADHPVSLYAATKKAAEAMAHAYAHLWKVPITVTRFFTVYGPWGRPDMALFSFVEAILDGRPIDIYGEGRMSRDFTYIDDVVEALARLVEVVPVAGKPAVEGDTLSPVAPWRIVNVGNGSPVGLMDFVAAIERHLGRQATVRMMSMQPGDIADTAADNGLLERLTGYRPGTPIDDGVKAFVEWYSEYHGK